MGRRHGRWTRPRHYGRPVSDLNSGRPAATCQACGGRRGFLTKASAKLYLAAELPAAQLRAYRCPNGTGLWHVGRQRPAAVDGVA